jgi:hypothetical protein
MNRHDVIVAIIIVVVVLVLILLGITVSGIGDCCDLTPGH